MPNLEQGASKGRGLLVILALMCALAVALASYRHTGSLAFPIDDGYIYSNYVLAAAQGAPFTYNSGELSGGITGLGWYFLTGVAYVIVAPFYALLGMLAPPLFRDDIELSRQAGHLYIASYLVGAACLVTTALGVRRLAELTLPVEGGRKQAHQAFCWLLGAVAAADLGLVWGAMSGLEATFAAAVVVWAAATLVSEAREGKLRWSLLLVALLPLARPDLVAIGAAGGLWLLARIFLPSGPVTVDRQAKLRAFLTYSMALLAGLGAMAAAFYIGWGNPLPGSFYAKVGGLRLGGRFFSAVEELLVAGRYLPFVVAAIAVSGALSSWLTRQESSDMHHREHRMAALLLLSGSIFYTVAIMLSLPWFGQEDRYLLPVHPLVIVLCGLLIWQLVRLFAFDALLSRRRVVRIGAALVILVFCAANYVWATRNYAVEVRNISDAHIAPARWLVENTPPESIIASEPIGAVKLFSGRRTVDLVGLTTPATLGTYRDWPRAWEALRAEGATHLLFYPRWFPGSKPPAWAVEVARFPIPDNKIAGDNLIALYSLDWTAYRP